MGSNLTRSRSTFVFATILNRSNMLTVSASSTGGPSHTSAPKVASGLKRSSGRTSRSTLPAGPATSTRPSTARSTCKRSWWRASLWSSTDRLASCRLCYRSRCSAYSLTRLKRHRSSRRISWSSKRPSILTGTWTHRNRSSCSGVDRPGSGRKKFGSWKPGERSCFGRR